MPGLKEFHQRGHDADGDDQHEIQTIGLPSWVRRFTNVWVSKLIVLMSFVDALDLKDIEDGTLAEKINRVQRIIRLGRVSA